MAIIETEIWKKSPDKPGVLVFDQQRKAGDIFAELKKHLEADGRLPDDYFIPCPRSIFTGDSLFPKDAEIQCNVNYGSSEGIYLDVCIRYSKKVYEYNANTKVEDLHERIAIEVFATGKTLGDTIEDLDKMHLAASSVMAAFYGMENQIHKRYAKIQSGEIQPVYSDLPIWQKDTAAEIADKAVNFAADAEQIKPGDLVLSIPEGENGSLIGCGLLIGKVIKIVPEGSPDHCGHTDSDDYYVDFFAPYNVAYSEQRKAELVEDFSEICGRPFKYEQLPLDVVIMPSEHLIKFHGIDMDIRNKILSSKKEAEQCYHSYFSEDRNKLFASLQALANQGMEDYRAQLAGLSKDEIIENAGMITAMSEAHEFITSMHRFSVEEIRLLLQFENPLKAFASLWDGYRADLDGIDSVMEHITDFKDHLLDSRHETAAGKPESRHQTAEPEPKQETSPNKPKSLAEKINIASVRVKAQDSQAKVGKSHNQEER